MSLLLLFLQGCKGELEEPTFLLSQVRQFYADFDVEETLAFACADESIDNLTYIYFYPPEGATNIQYFETRNLQSVKTNLNAYNKRILEMEDVFQGKLKRLLRIGEEDAFAIITFLVDDKFYQSEPISIKRQRLGTIYDNLVNLDFSTALQPKFSWNPAVDNQFYHQVVSDVNDNFLTGTFTELPTFRYGSFNNVIDVISLNIPDLVLNEDYKFTLFAIDVEFWVNVISTRDFVAQ